MPAADQRPRWSCQLRPFDGATKMAAFVFGGGPAVSDETTRMVRNGGGICFAAIAGPSFLAAHSTASHCFGTHTSAISPAAGSDPLMTLTTGPSTEFRSMVLSSSGSSSVSAGANGARGPNCNITRARTETDNFKLTLSTQLETLNLKPLTYRRSAPISLSYLDMMTSHR